MLTSEECRIYRDFVVSNQAYVYPLLASRIERLCRYPPKIVLDAGVGPGFLTMEFWHRCRAQITAIDINPTMLELARDLLTQHSIPAGAVELCIADIHTLPFTDGSFDVVMSYSCFHHWENPGQALQECFRVLAPGGLLYVLDTHKVSRDVVASLASRLDDQRQARFVNEAFAESWALEEVQQIVLPLNMIGGEVQLKPFAFDEQDILGALDRLGTISFPADDEGQIGAGPTAWELVVFKKGD